MEGCTGAGTFQPVAVLGIKPQSLGLNQTEHSEGYELFTLAVFRVL